MTARSAPGAPRRAALGGGTSARASFRDRPAVHELSGVVVPQRRTGCRERAVGCYRGPVVLVRDSVVGPEVLTPVPAAYPQPPLAALVALVAPPAACAGAPAVGAVAVTSGTEAAGVELTRAVAASVVAARAEAAAIPVVVRGVFALVFLVGLGGFLVGLGGVAAVTAPAIPAIPAIPEVAAISATARAITGIVLVRFVVIRPVGPVAL